MGVFCSDCITRGIGRYVWELMSPLWFVSCRNLTIDVPKGFLTDFASVPRFLWWAIPTTDGQYDAPAVVHDYAVRFRKVLGLRLTECHQLFHEALLARNVSRVKARAMWAAVYCFNWLCAGPGDGSVPPELLDRMTIKDAYLPHAND